MLNKKAPQSVNCLYEMQTLFNGLVNKGDIPKDDSIFSHAVDFFNLVVNFQDKVSGLNLSKQPMFKNAKVQISDLMLHISRTGRGKFNHVRAPYGQAVTLDNLYIGNKDQFWPLPASNWMKTKEEFKSRERNRLYSFIKYHTDEMKSLLKDIINSVEIKKENDLSLNKDGFIDIKRFKEELLNIENVQDVDSVFNRAVKFFSAVVLFQKSPCYKNISQKKQLKKFNDMIVKIISDNVIGLNLNGLLINDYEGVGRISLEKIKSENNQNKKLYLTKLLNYYKETLIGFINEYEFANKQTTFQRTYSSYKQKV